MCVFSQESWLKKPLTASKSEGACYGLCMQSWPSATPLALQEKERVGLQGLGVILWEPPFVGQGTSWLRDTMWILQSLVSVFGSTFSPVDLGGHKVKAEGELS